MALSRTRHELKIFAEDTDFLMAQAQESGVQRNPVELLERQAEPQTKKEVSVTQAVMDAPTQEAASPVKGYHQPQQQSPVQVPVFQARVETPIPRPTRKPEKDHPQPNQKPLTAKPQKKLPTSRSQPKPQRTTAKPQKLQPFWTPEHVGPPPFHIEEKHWRELVLHHSSFDRGG